MDEYSLLAAAVVRQALEDYKKALSNIRENYDVSASKRIICEVRKFLCSEWFRTLSDMDGEKLIALTEEEFA